VRVGYVPVGIKVGPEPPEEYPTGELYRGISFCDAVRRASDGSGRAFRLTRESIRVCRWAPVVLRFHDPDPRFDLKVGWTLPRPVPAILLAPVDQYGNDHPPDVVLVRTTPGELKKVLAAIGWENTAIHRVAGGLDRSALSIFRAGRHPLNTRRIQWVNRVLGLLNRSERWRDLTKLIFDRQWTTYLFDLLLDLFLANMSMCRNSTVIPYVTGKANISYFCTGGIAWGRNKPTHMTCGMPFSLYRRLEWKWD
jgi:hypothetical protein